MLVCASCIIYSLVGIVPPNLVIHLVLVGVGLWTDRTSLIGGPIIEGIQVLYFGGGCTSISRHCHIFSLPRSLSGYVSSQTLPSWR